MQAVTVSPIYVRSALKGAIKRGYNPEDILRAQGLPPEILSNAKLRISTLEFAKLSHTLTELLRDEAVGLLEKPQRRGTFHFLGRACLSCETIGEALKVWRQGYNLLDSSIAAYTRDQPHGSYLAIDCDIGEGIDDNYIIESILTTTHRFFCWLANEFIPIERVDLAYPEPSFSEEYRFLFYGAKVLFNQRQNAIHLSSHSLNLPCLRDANDLKSFFKSPHEFIFTLPRQTTSTSIKLRLWMEKAFQEGSGDPQLTSAADNLNMTEQTVRRRLKAEGYSFRQLKEDTRRDMAIYFINQRRLSVEQIGFKLGFSEASTFIRAFKKWTGVTPLAYRKM